MLFLLLEKIYCLHIFWRKLLQHLGAYFSVPQRYPPRLSSKGKKEIFQHKKVVVFVSPDMLFCGLFIQSEMYFGNPDCYMEWVDRLIIQTWEPPLSLSVATPLSPMDVIGYENGGQKIWPSRLPSWLCGRRTIKRYQRAFIREPWFFNNCSEKQLSISFVILIGNLLVAGILISLLSDIHSRIHTIFILDTLVYGTEGVVQA